MKSFARKIKPSDRQTEIQQLNRQSLLQVQQLHVDIEQKDNTIRRYETTITDQQRETAPSWLIEQEEVAITHEVVGLGGVRLRWVCSGGQG